MTNAQMNGCTLEGWECFVCGEIITTIGGGRDHFGATPNQTPGCLIKVQYGDERGLQIDLRRAQAKITELEDALAVINL